MRSSCASRLASSASCRSWGESREKGVRESEAGWYGSVRQHLPDRAEGGSEGHPAALRAAFGRRLAWASAARPSPGNSGPPDRATGASESRPSSWSFRRTPPAAGQGSPEAPEGGTGNRCRRPRRHRPPREVAGAKLLKVGADAGADGRHARLTVPGLSTMLKKPKLVARHMLAPSPGTLGVTK